MRSLDALEGRKFDVIVVGGGIYGVMAAWEASLRGITVCLIEKGDFGAETSSNSLKIIHGGLRYLQHANLVRMRESIRERRYLQQLAPHLISPVRFSIPIAGRLKSLAYGCAVRINDWISMDRNAGLPVPRQVPDGKRLNQREMVERFPWLDPADCNGGIEWYDCQTYSTERLLMAFLQAAVRNGVVALNYVKALKLEADGGLVIGIVAEDQAAGQRCSIKSDVVINATGPGSDAFLAESGISSPEPLFRPSLAFNVLLNQQLTTEAVGLSLGETYRDSDAVLGRAGRMYFIVPWRGMTLVGTKHLPCPKQPVNGEVDVQLSDAEALIRTIASTYPRLGIRFETVRHVFRGLLPETVDINPDGQVQLQKHHAIVDHGKRDGVCGLITVVGVKWTGARGVAEELINLVSRKLEKKRTRITKAFVQGGDFHDFASDSRSLLDHRPSQLPAEIAAHLVRSRGTDAAQIFAAIEANPQLAEPIIDGSVVCGAEIVSASREFVVHLEDVLVRRTEAALLTELDDASVLRCGKLVAGALEWSNQKLHAEIDRLQDSHERSNAR